MRLPRLSPGFLMIAATLVPGVLAVVFFLHAALPDTVELGWRFTAGQPFYEQVEQISRAASPGNAGAQLQQTTYVFRWTPLRISDAGNWVLDRRLERVKVASEIAGTRAVLYDSASPEDSNAIFNVVYQGLIGWESTVLLSPTQRLVYVSVPETPRVGSQIGEVTFFYDQAAQGAMVARLFCWVESRRVLANKPWQGQVPWDGDTLDLTFTYEGRANGLHRLTAERTPPAPPKPDAAVRQPTTQRTRVRGTAWFDRKLERLTRVEYFAEPAGKMLAGEPPLDETARQRIIITITDAPPE